MTDPVETDDFVILRRALMTCSCDPSTIALEIVDRLEARLRSVEGEKDRNLQHDRIEMDGAELDEIVLYGIAHLENLDVGQWYLGLTRPDGTGYGIWLSTRGRIEVSWEERDGPPLSRWDTQATSQATTREGLQKLHEIAADDSEPTEALKALMRGEIVHRPESPLTLAKLQIQVAGLRQWRDASIEMFKVLTEWTEETAAHRADLLALRKSVSDLTEEVERRR